MESEPIFFISCPQCGTQEVLVPNHLPREAVHWFEDPNSGLPILSMGFCAGCGVARVYAYDRAKVRRERAIGPERNPPQQQPPRQPDLGKCKHCGDTLVPANAECGGHLPGSWAVCVKCMRAWQIKDGQVVLNLEVGAAPPTPPSSESGKEGPPAENQLTEAKLGLIELVKKARAEGQAVPAWLAALVDGEKCKGIEPEQANQMLGDDSAPAEPEGVSDLDSNPDPDEGAK